MDIDLAALPDDVEALQRMVRALAAERTTEVQSGTEPRQRKLLYRPVG